MNPAEEEAANKEPTERPSVGAVAGSVDKLNEQLPVSAEDLLCPSRHQLKAGGFARTSFDDQSSPRPRECAAKVNF